MKKNKSVPGPSNYSPCPLEYGTFDRIKSSEKQRKKK